MQAILVISIYNLHDYIHKNNIKNTVDRIAVLRNVARSIAGDKIVSEWQDRIIMIYDDLNKATKVASDIYDILNLPLIMVIGYGTLHTTGDNEYWSSELSLAIQIAQNATSYGSIIYTPDAEEKLGIVDQCEG